ncbi:MAG: Bro-N domain-containing protein [Gammaproteobacteria bacterium]|nr:Bro-N domain-containing protein [Gammaproteobacteria bacterium]
MSSVAIMEYEGHQIRLVEQETGDMWFVAADVCRCVCLAINSRTGKPNVTVATRELSDTQKEKFRVDTPENPKNPWIDMMIVSKDGLMQMLSLSDTLKAQQFKQFVEQEYSKMNAGANYSNANTVE